MHGVYCLEAKKHKFGKSLQKKICSLNFIVFDKNLCIYSYNMPTLFCSEFSICSVANNNTSKGVSKGRNTYVYCLCMSDKTIFYYHHDKTRINHFVYQLHIFLAK